MTSRHSVVLDSGSESKQDPAVTELWSSWRDNINRKPLGMQIDCTPPLPHNAGGLMIAAFPQTKLAVFRYPPSIALLFSMDLLQEHSRLYSRASI